MRFAILCICSLHRSIQLSARYVDSKEADTGGKNAIKNVKALWHDESASFEYEPASRHHHIDFLAFEVLGMEVPAKSCPFLCIIFFLRMQAHFLTIYCSILLTYHGIQKKC